MNRAARLCSQRFGLTFATHGKPRVTGSRMLMHSTSQFFFY